ncbi:hypothetical protein P153DRAFT_341551 [Dothidotthia symphoricarpi CBS 119687]|uniref:SWIM-type domain-containing protein n=1 Tax=Dothidotthia symphoricarpi CBS 119687 TaxID=1392245 RepID=A0A6A6ADP2_9PLEO|nr:uncharacterized protein P153DRAFT_341551 [Dothidotthia symphoricarpi CBS 119687]KAF2129074.1 hypothetical protein P153DRAFT_341551 [Dothidotthia symphoricarpi CBS 119687]
MSLPTSRRFVAQLLEALSLLPQSDAENPLNAASEPAKKQLLSLQVLFPNEFLPALDLLDRRLVTRFRVMDEREGPRRPCDEPSKSTDNHTSNYETPLQHNPHDTIYYVRSAQQRSSRYSASYDTTTSYEVRLQSWNCSCPAFAFSAFPVMHSESPDLSYEPASEPRPHEDTVHGEGYAMDATKRDLTWAFGGATLSSDMPPVCKHILACVLVEECPKTFGAFAQESTVCVEEAAGWAAGWGD